MNKLAKTWPLKVFIRKSVVNQSYKSTTTTSNWLPNPPTSIKSQLVANRLRISTSLPPNVQQQEQHSCPQSLKVTFRLPYM